MVEPIEPRALPLPGGPDVPSHGVRFAFGETSVTLDTASDPARYRLGGSATWSDLPPGMGARVHAIVTEPAPGTLLADRHQTVVDQDWIEVYSGDRSWEYHVTCGTFVGGKLLEALEPVFAWLRANPR